MSDSFVIQWVDLGKGSNKIKKWFIALLAPIVVPLLKPVTTTIITMVGAQMARPICHKAKVPFYSKFWLDFGNYN
jgi:hypothetical protein